MNLNTNNIILILISLAIITILFVYIAYQISQNTKTINLTQTANGNTITGIGLACAPGQCVTNVYNGAKTCPQISVESLIANPLNEVCNDKFTCTSLRTPYSMQSDGSTSISGVCELGSVCRCLNKIYCANNILTVFKINNGNLYDSIANRRLTVLQDTFQSNTTTTVSGGNANLNNLIIENPVSEFCTISNSLLPNLAPGTCNNLNTGLPTDLSKCMNLNPCAAGTLAFLPDNLDDFKTADLDITPLACVYGKPCPVGKFALWDNINYKITCVNI